jgi:DNA-binding IclR family transcriptional regulator
VPVGDELPAHCTSVGKLLLACRPWQAVHDVLQRDGLPRMTRRTIVTFEALGDELAAVRRQGYAHEQEEHVANACGVAAPVRNSMGDVLAAVGMSVPADRWREGGGTYTRAVVAAAARASELVRHRVLQREQGLAAVV